MRARMFPTVDHKRWVWCKQNLHGMKRTGFGWREHTNAVMGLRLSCGHVLFRF